MENDKKIKVSFSALDPYIVSNVIKPTEEEVRGQNWVKFGTDNMYPKYLYDLFTNVSTLQSIINGICDYTVGENVKSKTILMSDEDIEGIVRDIAFSYAMYGGFYLNVLRNKMGAVAKVVVLDYRKVRVNKEHTLFYYSDDFVSNKTYGRCKCLVLPSFGTDKNNASSIFYYSNNKYQTYALPMWSGAVLSAECEKSNNEYQLNTIKNGFSGSYIVNMNNGIPTDEVKEEIEDAFFEKFCGEDNAGMPLLCWNNDKEHQTTIAPIPVTNFADRYEAMSKRAKNEIYSAFRAHPVLFGLPTENTGFNNQDFSEAFKLFNKTVITPIQKIIINSLAKIFGAEVAMIEPFNIDWSDEGDNNNENIN